MRHPLPPASFWLDHNVRDKQVGWIRIISLRCSRLTGRTRRFHVCSPPKIPQPRRNNSMNALFMRRGSGPAYILLLGTTLTGRGGDAKSAPTCQLSPLPVLSHRQQSTFHDTFRPLIPDSIILIDRVRPNIGLQAIPTPLEIVRPLLRPRRFHPPPIH